MIHAGDWFIRFDECFVVHRVHDDDNDEQLVAAAVICNRRFAFCPIQPL
jgi:hypothetical protein